MQGVIDGDTDQARTQYQRHHMHVAEQCHAGYRAKQHAHQHRNKCQQDTPAAKGQQ
ncbi:hypothetical protein D3C75_1108290 [compost metagenome]